MFRIRKIFTNKETVIFKVEGELNNEGADAWTEALVDVRKVSGKQIILDLSSVLFKDSSTVRSLQDLLRTDMYLMNCTGMTRNILQASNCGKYLLE